MTTTTADEKTRIRMESLSDLAGDAALAPRSPLVVTENGLHQKLLVERVMRALGELTPQQRLMFLLKHREGMTYQEISEALGCSTGAIKKSLFRTILKLRAALGISAEAADCFPLATGENG